MTEVEDDDADGFQRLAKYRKSVHPARVSAWFNGRTVEAAPASALKALKKLDAMATGWRGEGEIRTFLRWDRHPLTDRFLALDVPDGSARIRAAVLRSYEVAWRYANVYCDWLDAIADAKRISTGIDRFLKSMDGDLWNVADGIDAFSRYYPDHPSATRYSERFGSITRDLEEYSETLNIWAAGQREMAKELKRREPRSFLILRLCEVYAIFSGAEFSFHASGKETSGDASPDRLLSAFLIAAQEAFRFPVADAGLDNILRGLDRQHRQVGGLGSRYVSGHKWKFDYASLPSVGILIDFAAFDDDIL